MAPLLHTDADYDRNRSAGKCASAGALPHRAVDHDFSQASSMIQPLFMS
jgi:hypothetical protein